VLVAAQLAKSPVILGVSEGAAKYMGSYDVIVAMVKTLLNDLQISVPVCLHLDHGSYKACLEAIKAGFTSIMYDGSHEPFNQNISNTKTLVQLCEQHNLSLEVEVGTIGGYEDGNITSGELANLDDCIEISQLDIDFLAAGIGNIHGVYPPN